MPTAVQACASCGAGVPFDPARDDGQRIPCPTCKKPVLVRARSATVARSEVARPAFVWTANDGRGLTVRFPEFSGAPLLGAFIGVVVAVQLLGGLVLELVRSYPAVAAGLGAVLAWALIRATVAPVTVRTTDDDVVVSVGPLPRFVRATVPQRDITQLFVREHQWFVRDKGRRDDDPSRAGVGRRITTYRVMAKTKDGRDVEVAGGIRRKNVALYLEQELERHLKLTDAAIGGEVART